MLNAFFSSFFLIGIAEIADKSRVAGLLLVAAYGRPSPVFWGMTAAYVILDGAAIFFGSRVPMFFNAPWIRFALGALLVGFGAATLLIKVGEERNTWIERLRRFPAFPASFALIAVTEMGDRTQITSAVLAARYGLPWMVFGGAIASLAFLNLATVLWGEKIFARLPMALLQKVGAALFIAFGIAMFF